MKTKLRNTSVTHINLTDEERLKRYYKTLGKVS